jgi:hypothetical protein
MTNRTFLQQGQGFGSETVTITASINGAQVYTGPINTLNQPIPSFPDSGEYPVSNLYTWTNTVDFQGTQNLEITVQTGTLLLMDSLANYGFSDNPNPPTPTVPGGTVAYEPFFSIDIGGIVISDPLTNVVINNVPQTPARDSNLDGQWFWTIPANGTFTATINVQPGFEVSDWNDQTSYVWGTWVQGPTQMYLAYTQTTIPAGTPLTDSAYWAPIPMSVWDIDQSYSLGAVACHNGTGYRALQNVTPGTDIINSTFWGKTYLGAKP